MAARPVADVVDLAPEIEDEEPTNYALRLTEALDAITAAQHADAPAAAVPAPAPTAVPAPAPASAASAAAHRARAAFAEVLQADQEVEEASVAPADAEDAPAVADEALDDAEPVSEQPRNRVAS